MNEFENFVREALLEADELAETGVARLSFSSEKLVLRRDKTGKFFEQLSHGAGDVNLGLLNSQGVVLEDHNDRKQIGEVVKHSAKVDADKKTRATIKVTDDAWQRRMKFGAKSIPVSVGYTRLSLLRELPADESGIVTRVYSWKPFEISLLTVEPADETVGIGRSKDNFMKKNSLEELLSLALSGSRKTEDNFTRDKLREYSLADVIKRQMEGAYVPREKSLELDCHAEASRTMPWGQHGVCGTVVPFGALLSDRDFKRDMQADVFGAGGAAVQSEWHPVVQLLHNKLVCLPLGAQVIPGLTSNFISPRETSALAPGMTSEIGVAPQSQITLDQESLKPCRATIQVPVSLLLLQQTAGAIEQTLRRAISSALGVLVDRLALFGQGANNEPLGLFNQPGIGSVTFGGAADWSHILKFEQNISLLDADVDGGSLGWAISTNTRAKFKNASRIAATNYPSFIMQDGKINGFQARTSMQMSGNDQVIFGAWNDFYILMFGEGIDLLVDAITQTQNGKAIITAHLWFNVLPLHPQSFCASADSGAQ